MYLKRNNIEKFWPIPRKGTKYLAVATHNKKESIPLVVVVRDILKIVRNKKELKRLINEKKVQINHKEIRETNYPVCLFDIISFPIIKKNYKAILLKNKKITFKEVSDKESKTKIFKVIGKKILKNKKTQLNLMHGINILSNEKAKVGDSVLLNLKDKKIIKVIQLKKDKTVFIIKGKHAGYEGKIKEIVKKGGKNIAKISLKHKEINVWTKNIVVIK